MGRSQILAVGIDKVTMNEAVARCLAFVDSGIPHLVVTPNAEIVYTATQDAELARIVNAADLVLADGAGVLLAAKLLNDPVPQKVAGVDVATRLVAELNRRSGRVYLLGAKPDVVQEAARRLRERYPQLTVACRDGYFGPDEEAAVIAEIRASRSDVLFAGMGAPRQEKWLAQHLGQLGVPVAIGVGGTIDLWAGVAERAPEWMIKVNLEWLFRIVKFGRYGRSLPPLVKFVLAVMTRKVRGGGGATSGH